MTELYHYLVLLIALVSFGVAGAVYWKNRYQALGPCWGLNFVSFGLWAAAFSQYFQAMPVERAVWWGKLTLTLSIINHPLYFHAFCVLMERARRLVWWVITAYVLALGFVFLVWSDQFITGLRSSPFMDHYVAYDRFWYAALGLYMMGFIGFAFVMLVRLIRESVGYKRTQLSYFFVAAIVVFLMTDSIILPIEYGFNIPPFGFFILPFNLAILGYVLSQARLADFNIVVARTLMHTLTLLVVAAVTLVAIAIMRWKAPGFMNMAQLSFTVLLVLVIGLLLAITLPRWLPRAERVMKERLFASRYGYQTALTGVSKDLGRLPDIERILATVASSIHAHMQLSRVLVFMEDPIRGAYRVEAQSGLNAEEPADSLQLPEESVLVAWLEEHKETLVREEIERKAPAKIAKEIIAALNRLRISVVVPMVVEEKLIGMMCLGDKASRDQFFQADIQLLESMTTEVSLTVRYRRMQEEIFRKNRLVELGTIAAGVAHEIRNPLASIRTFAQLMPSRMDDPEFKNEFSKLVLKDVDRITKVIETMLAFARPSQVTIAEHSVVDLVEEAILLVQPRLKSKRIELTKQFHEQPQLRVDRQQILQVLVNILNNASDALPEQGKIRIATGIRSVDLTGTDEPEKTYGVIEISDNGPGIPSAVRNRLFDPFFTTKKDGTGLGLSISQKIVRDHGGLITVSSVEGKGTSFHVNLPVNPTKPATVDKIVQVAN